MTTPIESKAAILSDFWMSFRDDENYQDFIEYADLALPLSYAIDAGIIKNNEKVSAFIEEAFELLCSSFGIEDTGFDSLDEMLDAQIED
jgi:hypothetical protein